MQQEIEAKFLAVDHDEIRRRLKNIGATLEQPMRLMRRVLFDFPDGRLQKDNWGRVRVRDEGDKVTLTYKSDSSNEYSNEIETTVGSFDDTVALLKVIGLQPFTSQESKRETWQYKDVEVVLDEWPWLKPYIEIEGPNEEAIKACAAALGFEWEEAFFGNVDTAYRHDYQHMLESETIGAVTELQFDTPMPEWLKARQ